MLELFFRDIPYVQRNAQREAERSAILLLLREVLGKDNLLAHTDEGKPYLPKYPHLHISISHTQGMVMLALSDAPLGVDIELRSRDMSVVAHRVLPRRLHRAIAVYGVDLAGLLYQIAWTSAESLFKLVESSTLISDFVYRQGSLVLDVERQTFSLVAVYKEAPEVPLFVEGSFEGDYIYAVASLLSDAE